MKKSLFIIILLGFSATQLFPQNGTSYTIPLIGSVAPSFKAESTNGQINFPEDYGKNWKIIFSHPQDFTPVCSSELLELAHLQSEFEKLGVKVLVVSTDKVEQHFRWKASLETITYEGRAPEKINFPIVSDDKYLIADRYGMLHEPTSTSKDIRGVFIIDPDNIIQAIYFYPVSVGRNMDEIVRTVEALQIANNNIVTPANWEPGDDVMLKYMTDEDKAENQGTHDSDVYELTWYMVFKKMD